MGSVLWSILPETVRNQIVPQVRSGCGLFITGNAKDKALAELLSGANGVAAPRGLHNVIPYRLFPAFAASGSVPPYAACRLGKGLVLTERYSVGDSNMAFSPQLTIPEMTSLPATYDYYQSMVVKALLLAANRLGETDRISGVSVPAQPTDRSAQPHVGVTVAARAGEQAAGVRLRIRDGAEKSYFTARRAYAPDAGFQVPTTVLPVGRYFADAWLLDRDDRVLDWMGSTFEVTDPQGFAELTTGKPAVAAGQEMELGLKLRRALGERERVGVTAVDFYQRSVFDTTLTGTGQTQFACRIPTASVLSLTATVHARLERSGQIVAEKSVEFPVIQPSGQGPGWDDFSFMVWSYGDSAPADYVFRRLREAGMDRLMTGAWLPVEEHVRQAAVVNSRYNCRPFPFSYWIGDIGGCDADRARTTMQDLDRALEPYSCDAYGMGR